MNLELNPTAALLEKAKKFCLPVILFFQNIEIISPAQLIFVKSQKRNSRFIKFFGQYWKRYTMTSNATRSCITSFVKEII